MLNRFMMQFGADGLIALLLSTTVVIVTCGLSLGWPLRDVMRTARNAPLPIPPGGLIVVLGMRLRNGAIVPDYAIRLDRVVSLCREDGCRKILIVGGRTGRDEISEAEKGEEFLIDSGIDPDHIHLEQSSQNTLENLRNARSILKQDEAVSFALVTNRYHLARCELIASGLGLQPVLCGAEDRFEITAVLLPRLLMEAFYIHWYRTGIRWTQLSGRKKSLARIR